MSIPAVSAPAERGAWLAERALALAPERLPVGVWLLSDGDQPGDLWEITVDEAGPSQIARLNTPAVLGRLGKVALVSLAWLLRQDPDGRTIGFNWSQLSAAFNPRRRPNAELIGYLRAAIEQLSWPSMAYEAAALRGSGSARWARAETISFFEKGRLHLAGDGPSGPGGRPNELIPHPRLRVQLAAGAWSSVAPGDLLSASGELVRRLWLYATAASLTPAGADGIIRVPLAVDPLLAVLGVTDSRERRARRRFAAAVAELGERDRRFALSELLGPGGDTLLLVRDRPLHS